ncbi:unnamed protein product [Mortierella alpina]
MALKYRVDFKTSLKLHFVLFFFLLLVLPSVTLGVIPPGGSSITEWMLSDENNNNIPSFSRVGYRQGHIPIPVFPVMKTLEPSADLSGDDTARIQAAIDEVGMLEPSLSDGTTAKGAVLLKRGVYHLNGTLFINKSGVVLRGEGPKDVTILRASSQIEGGFILISSERPSSKPAVSSRKGLDTVVPVHGIAPVFVQGEPSSLQRNPDYTSGIYQTQISEYIPVGATMVPVQSTTGFRVHDKIAVEMQSSQKWIDSIDVTFASNSHWSPSRYEFSFERMIVAIDKERSTITVDIPMVMNVDLQHFSAIVSHLPPQPSRISDVGGRESTSFEKRHEIPATQDRVCGANRQHDAWVGQRRLDCRVRSGC